MSRGSAVVCWESLETLGAQAQRGRDMDCDAIYPERIVINDPNLGCEGGRGEEHRCCDQDGAPHNSTLSAYGNEIILRL